MPVRRIVEEEYFEDETKPADEPQVYEIADDEPQVYEIVDEPVSTST